MRRAARRDANHSEIRDGLRALGWSVLDLGAVGGGCPDTLVGAAGVNVLVEIKDGEKSASHRRLRDSQREFLAAWRGPAYCVETLYQAVEVVSAAIDDRRQA